MRISRLVFASKWDGVPQIFRLGAQSDPAIVYPRSALSKVTFDEARLTFLWWIILCVGTEPLQQPGKDLASKQATIPSAELGEDVFPRPKSFGVTNALSEPEVQSLQ